MSAYRKRRAPRPFGFPITLIGVPLTGPLHRERAPHIDRFRCRLSRSLKFFEEYGVPHYLKIDIEGNDQLCIEALRATRLPRYISVESECVGDSAVLSDQEALAMLELLRDVGYRRFKLVNQEGWASIRSHAATRFWLRLVTSAARGRLRVRGLSGIAERFTDSGRIAATSGFVFSPGSSGPWGDDIPGGWMTYAQARSTYLRERRPILSRKPELYAFWYDWHATY